MKVYMKLVWELTGKKLIHGLKEVVAAIVSTVFLIVFTINVVLSFIIAAITGLLGHATAVIAGKAGIEGFNKSANELTSILTDWTHHIFDK